MGLAVSVVRQVEIAGVKMEIDTSVVEKVKEFLGDSIQKLDAKAKGQYDKFASGAFIAEKLRLVVRQGLQEVLHRNNLAQWPSNLRATVHVPDIVFKDYLYQLVDYYPRSLGHPAGRRFSQRYGIIGRAWRLGRSIGRGKAVTGADAALQLIMYWGMQPDEADGRSHQQPANLCVILFDPDDNNKQVGLLYVDSTDEDAFGVDPLDAPIARPTPGTAPASDAGTPAPAPADDAAFADAVAVEVQNHQLTRELAKAVAQIITPLRMAGPSLDVTDTRTK